MSGALPPLSSPLGSFLASLLSVVFSFGSPEVSFLWFVVSSGLLYLLYTLRFPLFAAVALTYTSSGFPVSLLACSVLHPRLPGVFCLLSYGFFLISFPSMCCLSVFTFGSHLLVRPGATLFVFLPRRSATQARVPDSVFACLLLRLFLASRRCPILDIGSVLSLLPCLPFFRNFPLPFNRVFLAYLSLLYQTVCCYMWLSFFFIPFRLIRSCFGASGLRCLPCGSFVSVVYFLGVFISFPCFRLRFFLIRVSIIFPCWCVRIVFWCSPSLEVMLFSLFSFSFVFIGLAYGVSSLAFFILAPCVAWLSASLSFAFSRLAYALSFLILPVLSALCFIPTVLFVLCFPDFVRYFLFLCVLLIIVSSVFSRFVSVFLCLQLFMVRLSCVFLTSLGAFPVVFVFRIFSSASASFSYLSFLLSSSGILSSSSSCFHWIFWGSILFLGLLFLLRFRLWLRLSLPFCILSTFSTCCGSGCSLRSYLAFFPHAVATAGFPVFLRVFCLLRLRLPLLSSSALQYDATPAAHSGLHTPFSAYCASGCSFAFGAPHAVFRAAGSPFTVPRLSGCCFSLRFCSFSILGISPNDSFIIGLFPQAAFSPLVSAPPRACLWCSSLRLRFLLRWSAFLCFVWHYSSLVLLTRSDLRFLSRRGLPLGRVRVAMASVLSVSRCLHVVVSILCLSQLCSSVSFTS